MFLAIYQCPFSIIYLFHCYALVYIEWNEQNINQIIIGVWAVSPNQIVIVRIILLHLVSISFFFISCLTTCKLISSYQLYMYMYNLLKMCPKNHDVTMTSLGVTWHLFEPFIFSLYKSIQVIIQSISNQVGAYIFTICDNGSSTEIPQSVNKLRYKTFLKNYTRIMEPQTTMSFLGIPLLRQTVPGGRCNSSSPPPPPHANGVKS